jgi:hypothetical protein
LQEIHEKTSRNNSQRRKQGTFREAPTILCEIKGRREKQETL